MKIEYDKLTDMAYIYLKDEIGRGEAKHSQECTTSRRRVVLDFDAQHRLIGIEVFDAAATLPAELLK